MSESDPKVLLAHITDFSLNKSNDCQLDQECYSVKLNILEKDDVKAQLMVRILKFENEEKY